MSVQSPTRKRRSLCAYTPPGFSRLPGNPPAKGLRRQPDYGAREFTEELTRKFHQGTKKAIAQARKAGLL